MGSSAGRDKTGSFRVSALVCLLLGLALTSPLTAEDKPPAPQPAPSEKAQEPNRAAASSQAEAETAALDKAFSAAPGDPQALIKNLEAFLQRYPQSARREQVLRMIYKQALQANDPRKAAETAEKLLEFNPDDPDLLGTLTDLYGRQGRSGEPRQGAQLRDAVHPARGEADGGVAARRNSRGEVDGGARALPRHGLFHARDKSTPNRVRASKPWPTSKKVWPSTRRRRWRSNSATRP